MQLLLNRTNNANVAVAASSHEIIQKCEGTMLACFPWLKQVPLAVNSLLQNVTHTKRMNSITAQ